MAKERGEINIEGLVRIALVLVILLFMLELVGELFGWLLGLLMVFRPLILLAVAALVVLWLADRL